MPGPKAASTRRKPEPEPKAAPWRAAPHLPLYGRVPGGMRGAQKRHAACNEAIARAGLRDGHGAPTPAQIPVRGWGQLLVRCFWRVFEDRVLGEAAAVAFY